MCEAMEAGKIDKQTYNKRMNESDEEALSDFL